MGINKNAGIRYMLSEEDGFRYYMGKSILMLGKQDVEMTYDEFVSLCDKIGFEYLEREYNEGKIDSVTMFKMMGFSTVHSLDVSDYEGAEIIFNLNNRDLPEQVYHAYDYIYDGGTLEHIFDFATGLINTSKMLKCNGIIIHDIPSENWMDHGFYTISPTLFYDYYTVNRFKIKQMYLLGIKEGKADVISADCRYNDNFQFIQDHINGEKVHLVCISKKLNVSSETIIPTQSLYKNMEKNWKYGKFNKDEKIDKIIYFLNKCKDNSVTIYGAGDTTSSIIDMCNKENNIIRKIAGIYSRDKKLAGQSMYGMKLLNMEDIHKDGVEAIIIGSLSHHTEEIYQRLKYLEEDGIKIIKISDL